ncbi:hypothetical protein Godav_022292 [Gossypium davidsonii]|uniref:Uncharacterized protein n=1 Tax=Gossypium davidsonii TaxID=34287 RepID=A0A7J8TAI2_GOSDV|nr:hypothetical protein [Gossypium davidsonii]
MRRVYHHFEGRAVTMGLETHSQSRGMI